MSQPAGRREANKKATRAALHQAADQLFARQGYEATTVAQIAEAARVGERTFYRYFDSKEDLLAERARAWLRGLRDAIRNRPARENAYQAVSRALTALAGDLTREEPGQPGHLLTAQQPLVPLRRIEPRPARRLEEAIAEAVLDRWAGGASAGDPGPPPPEAEFEAQLVARVAMAALRTVIVWQRTHPAADGPGLERQVGRAFARLSRLASAE